MGEKLHHRQDHLESLFVSLMNHGVHLSVQSQMTVGGGVQNLTKGVSGHLISCL
jgi:hypothetical protein